MNPKMILRGIAPEDTDNIVKWRNSPSVRRNLYSQTGLTVEQHLLYLKNVVYAGKCVQYIIEIVEDKGAHQDIGTIFIKSIDHASNKGEFGIFIGEENWRGKGYAQLATKEILSIAFNQLNLNRVYLTVMADNYPAIKAYENCSFIKEGLLKEDYLRSDGYVDVIVMGITKNMWMRN